MAEPHHHMVTNYMANMVTLLPWLDFVYFSVIMLFGLFLQYPLLFM